MESPLSAGAKVASSWGLKPASHVRCGLVASRRDGCRSVLTLENASVVLVDVLDAIEHYSGRTTCVTLLV